MTDDNGKRKKEVPEAVLAILGKLDASKTDALWEMVDTLPNVRAFLLGAYEGNRKLPGGQLVIRVGRHGPEMIASIPAIGVEAVYTFDSFEDTVRALEHSLREETVPWVSDWRRSKKEASEWSGLA